jgi:hypothetical protein
MSVKLEIVKAAFVILYDSSIAGKGSYYQDITENIINNIRKNISSSRKEAQYVLVHDTSTDDAIMAAFVLAYEGIGAQRMEKDFVFEAEDILSLNDVRDKLRMSSKRAFSLLSTHL